MFDEDFLTARGHDPYTDHDISAYIEDAKNTVFHVKAPYQKEVVPTYQCKECKGIEFNVGRSGFYTIIKCINCKWENCIHAG